MLLKLEVVTKNFSGLDYTGSVSVTTVAGTDIWFYTKICQSGLTAMMKQAQVDWDLTRMVTMILVLVTISLIQQDISLRVSQFVYLLFVQYKAFSGNIALRVAPLLCWNYERLTELLNTVGT